MPEEILKNLYRLKINLPNSPLKNLNSYVIKGVERNIIIDTGFNHPDCKEELLSGLNELDVSLENTDIILTHLHSDHSGLAPEIAVTGTRVFISREEIPWMFGQTRRDLWAMDNKKLERAGFDLEALKNSLKSAASRSMASNDEFENYLPIDAGDEFFCGGYTLKAVVTPGHTPAHMCFWMAEQKTIFTGDHVLFDISPNITLWNNVEDSLGDYLTSLKKIDEYDVRLALPGHRESGSFHERIAYLLEHHEMRLKECYNEVLNNPNSSVFDIAGKMTWKIRCNSWEDFPINQKWFAVGECHSHLRHLEKLGKVEANEEEHIIKYKAI
ncbi:MAG: MBL fold metallo-hydrolase [Oscillospiraceae bacterium]|nr:MBL fold metallo-hydrolase [Oscillospiraceae bacterium]